jgi:hypothetical protein
MAIVHRNRRASDLHHALCSASRPLSTSTMATTSPERFAEDEDGGDHADEWDQQ